MNNIHFNVSTQQFEGPLELLLSLIQERKLYINEISLAQVTDAYLTYLESFTEHPLAETAQFVYIAATLLLIKSRSLLPGMVLTEEEERDIYELERRLEQYRSMRKAARTLGKMWNTAPLLPPRYRTPIVSEFTPEGVTLDGLVLAMKELLRTLPSSAFRATVHVARTLSLEEVVERLRSRILRTSRLLFSEIKKGGSKADIIVHFLAILELVKSGFVAAEQKGTFDDIIVGTDEVGTPHYE